MGEKSKHRDKHSSTKPSSSRRRRSDRSDTSSDSDTERRSKHRSHSSKSKKKKSRDKSRKSTKQSETLSDEEIWVEKQYDNEVKTDEQNESIPYSILETLESDINVNENDGKHISQHSNLSDRAMAYQEKLDSNSHDMDTAFLKQVFKTDADFSSMSNIEVMERLDDQAEILSKMGDSSSKPKKKINEKQKLISNHKKLDKTISSCKFCFTPVENNESNTESTTEEYMAPKVPVVAIGLQTFLALPTFEVLVDGQCSIHPIEHFPCDSSLNLDSNIWDEIRNFQKCVTLMFHEKGSGTLFMETSIPRGNGLGNHISIECFPIPYKNDTFINARLYFKQAILSSDDEWTVHNKLIDTRKDSTKGGFRNKMSSKVPYFHIWFDLDGGYGHVIENRDYFAKSFGHEIIASLLKLPVNLARKPKNIIFSHNQRTKASSDWKSMFGWEKYDWTKSL
ncbi:hypothetical protein BB559_000205 [Furculomyces boomerangus]|uniref:Cwf19-like C-terminal domain-containing protein n=1 Tax=Furculomyces boomerangus TaxID=61424 RepID=A0A2T9Z5Y3_9FUNG|nr:hypothetical protein BB559_000205 [Furculomyces boomerangus]